VHAKNKTEALVKVKLSRHSLTHSHTHIHTPCMPAQTSSSHTYATMLVQMFILRKLIEKELRGKGINEDECYFCSLSSKTIVYKGQLTPKQVGRCLNCVCLCYLASQCSL